MRGSYVTVILVAATWRCIALGRARVEASPKSQSAAVLVHSLPVPSTVMDNPFCTVPKGTAESLTSNVNGNVPEHGLGNVPVISPVPASSARPSAGRLPETQYHV